MKTFIILAGFYTTTLAIVALSITTARCEEPKNKVTTYTTPKSDVVPVIPTIPLELENKFLRARIQKQSAFEAANSANEQEQAIGKEMIAVCGEKYTPQEGIRPDGKSLDRFVCVAKPIKPEIDKK